MSQRSRTVLLKTGAGLALVLVVGVLYLSPARSYMTIEYARAVVETLRSLWYGPLIFMGLYMLGCIFAAPATIFVVSGGIIWGWAFGGAYALLGGSAGAALAFLIGRFIGGGLLSKLGRHGRRVEKQLETGGFHSMLILRLVPLVPFPVLNYAGGVARMRFSHFILATLIGSAPSIFIISYSADAIANGSLTARGAFLRIFVVGALLGSMVLAPRLLRRRMQRAALGVDPPGSARDL